MSPETRRFLILPTPLWSSWNWNLIVPVLLVIYLAQRDPGGRAPNAPRLCPDRLGLIIFAAWGDGALFPVLSCAVVASSSSSHFPPLCEQMDSN